MLISDLGLAIVVCGLTLLGRVYGWAWLLQTYLIPYFMVNHWLVMITYLQHTHPGETHCNIYTHCCIHALTRSAMHARP